MIHLVHVAMQNIMLVSSIGALLVIAPLMGIMIIHEGKDRY
jgi:hypothetical protein